MSVVIATTTFYKKSDETRALLAFASASKAAQSGYPMIVVDGGSPEAFRARMRNAGAIILDELTPGMGAGRRQALKEAHAVAGYDGAVVWMEPEKHTLICDLQKVAAPVLEKSSDMVIPRRENLSSYPPEQELAERLGNLAFEYLTGKNFDMWFGVRAMNARALSYFLSYQGEYGDRWDSIFIPVLRTIRDNLRITSVSVNYLHPVEQTSEEVGNITMLKKRIDQLMNLVPSLEAELKNRAGNA